MALKAVTKAMKWGHRDQSHGTLFTRPAFLEKNSSLLLWSGVSPELRGAWCKSLNLYMFLCRKEFSKVSNLMHGKIMENYVCLNDVSFWRLMVFPNGSRNSNACGPLFYIVDRVFNPNIPQMEGLGVFFFMMPNRTFHNPGSMPMVKMMTFAPPLAVSWRCVE